MIEIYLLIIVSKIFRSSLISILLLSAIDFSGVSILASIPFCLNANCSEVTETAPSFAMSCKVFSPKLFSCNLCFPVSFGAINS